LDRVGLVAYGTFATLDMELTDDFDAVEGAIDDLRAWGFTNIGAAISMANDELETDGRCGSVWVEILFSDGRPNVPLDNAVQYAKDVAAEAAGLDIIIYTIGLASDIDEDLLAYISDKTGGSQPLLFNYKTV